MIGKLKGILDTIAENFVIIDVGGVGYQIFASGNTLRALPQIGGNASLFIITHVREDHIHLYGFASEAEKKWFDILTTVNGVGAKVGMSILSALTPEQLNAAIAAQDKAALTTANGVGGRLAERILTELKGKVDGIGAEIAALNNLTKKGKAGGDVNLANDAISALTNLGYNRSQAYGAVQRAVASKPHLKLEELIKEGLKELVNG